MRERERLSAQLNELEIAERVLARFEGKAAKTGSRRARSANIAAAVGKKHRAQGKRQMPTMSLSDATLKAVQAHDEGATASEVLNYLSREFGMAVRPNHLGMALQRHRRAGRLTTVISAGTYHVRHRNRAVAIYRSRPRRAVGKAAGPFAAVASIAYHCAAGEARPSGGQTIKPSASGMRRFRNNRENSSDYAGVGVLRSTWAV